MNKSLQNVMESLKPDLLRFVQKMVAAKSYTGNEKAAAELAYQEMLRLNFDQAYIDEIGNAVGIIGNGPTTVFFDGHIDTVKALPEEWAFNPWAGDIIDGFVRGRGSTDMKASICAAVYGAWAARELGYDAGKTIIVSCSVMEEDFEGVAVNYELKHLPVKPDFAVICEPTHLQISNGHYGRALFEITSLGKGIHASRHQMGDNALNKILPVIERVEQLGKKLLAAGDAAGSIASTQLETDSMSINTIPGRAVLTVDRRIAYTETEELITKEMDALCAEIPDTAWKVVEAQAVSWTGITAPYRNFINSWRTPEDHPLVRAACATLEALGHPPVVYRRDGCTNGWVTCGQEKIPTIIFGAGHEKNAHVINETCPIDQILTACSFYAQLENEL